MPNKKLTAFRLGLKDLHRLDALVKLRESNRSACVREAIRLLAAKEGIK